MWYAPPTLDFATGSPEHHHPMLAGDRLRWSNPSHDPPSPRSPGHHPHGGSYHHHHGGGGGISHHHQVHTVHAGGPWPPAGWQDEVAGEVDAGAVDYHGPALAHEPEVLGFFGFQRSAWLSWIPTVGEGGEGGESLGRGGLPE